MLPRVTSVQLTVSFHGDLERLLNTSMRRDFLAKVATNLSVSAPCLSLDARYHDTAVTLLLAKKQAVSSVRWWSGTEKVAFQDGKVAKRRPHGHTTSESTESTESTEYEVPIRAIDLMIELLLSDDAAVRSYSEAAKEKVLQAKEKLKEARAARPSRSGSVQERRELEADVAQLEAAVQSIERMQPGVLARQLLIELKAERLHVTLDALHTAKEKLEQMQADGANANAHASLWLPWNAEARQLEAEVRLLEKEASVLTEPPLLEPTLLRRIKESLKGEHLFKLSHDKSSNNFEREGELYRMVEVVCKQLRSHAFPQLVTNWTQLATLCAACDVDLIVNTFETLQPLVDALRAHERTPAGYTAMTIHVALSSFAECELTKDGLKQASARIRQAFRVACGQELDSNYKLPLRLFSGSPESSVRESTSTRSLLELRRPISADKEYRSTPSYSPGAKPPTPPPSPPSPLRPLAYEAEFSPMSRGYWPGDTLAQILTGLLGDLIEVCEPSHEIKVLQGEPFLARRQDLEASVPEDAFVPKHTAARMMGSSGARNIKVLSYGWRHPVNPDPDGDTLAAIIAHLTAEAKSDEEATLGKAVFIECAHTPRRACSRYPCARACTIPRRSRAC